MSNTALDSIQALVKALEAGSYNAAPSTLTQGAALQIEDLSPVLHNVTFSEKEIKLQKMVSVEACKSTLAQFDRQLSYGQFGGSAQLEGGVGQEETSQFVRVVVPMAYYSHTRRVTLASTMVATVDGKKSEERAAADAAKKIAGDVEFDLFRGRADFSNGGAFDGNPNAMPAEMAGMIGLDVQIRQSDVMRQAKDLMFAEYGSDDSCVLSVGGTLDQATIENASLRSSLAFGNADTLIVDPKVLANYNKISFGKERIIVAGSAPEATGAELRKQWTSGGTVQLEASQFLRAKAKPQEPRSNGPGAPASISLALVPGAGTAFVGTVDGKPGQKFVYFVTTGNEVGESRRCAEQTVTINASGDAVDVTINHPASGVARWFNVYRSPAGGTVESAQYIGRVQLNAGGSSTVFRDLGNKKPGFVTGFLVQADSMTIKELAPYSRQKLAQTDLSMVEAHFRFLSLAVTRPRVNVILDNLA